MGLRKSSLRHSCQWGWQAPSPTAPSLLTEGRQELQPSQSQLRTSSTVTVTEPCPVPYPHILLCSRISGLKPPGQPAAPPAPPQARP